MKSREYMKDAQHYSLEKKKSKTIIDTTTHNKMSLIIVNIGEIRKQPEPYTLLVGMQKQYPLWKTV